MQFSDEIHLPILLSTLSLSLLQFPRSLSPLPHTSNLRSLHITDRLELAEDIATCSRNANRLNCQWPGCLRYIHHAKTHRKCAPHHSFIRSVCIFRRVIGNPSSIPIIAATTCPSNIWGKTATGMAGYRNVETLPGARIMTWAD